MRSAGWTVLSRLGGRVIDFLVLILLARFLSPGDFGVVAIAASIISIVEMILDVPVTQALVRINNLTQADLDTGFTIGLLRGFIVAVLVLAVSYPLSLAYSDQRLFALIIALSIGPIVRGIYSPSMVHLLRQMRFMPIFMMEISGKIVGALAALAFAVFLSGYWALAANSIAASVAPACISYFIAPYRPRISVASMSKFLTFTGWYTSSQLIAALSWQYDRIFLGYFLTPSQLGRYTMASDLSVLSSQAVVGPAMRPLTSAFVNVVGDAGRLTSAYLRSINLIFFVAAPISIGVAIEATDIITITLGTQWDDTVRYLPWLALANLFSIYLQPVSALATALDKPRFIFQLNLFEGFVRVVLSSAAFLSYGINGFLISRIISGMISFVNGLFLVRRAFGIDISSQIAVHWRTTVGCFSIFVATLITKQHLPSDFAALTRLIIVSSAGSVVYFLVMYILGFRVKTL